MSRRLALSLSCVLSLAGCSADPDASPTGSSGVGAAGGQGSGGAAAGSGGSGGIAGAPTGCSAAAGRALCRVETEADWGGATLEGVAVTPAGLMLASSGLVSGTDAAGIYNGGAFVSGAVTTADLEPRMPFDRAVVSWNALTPAGSWIAIEASARVGTRWTAWYRMGVWASGDSDVMRHSFDGEADADGSVATDTLKLQAPADAVRVRATLFSADPSPTPAESPTLARLAVTLADTGAPPSARTGGPAWGITLDVPPRSQMVFPDGGEVWCSPTSTSMLLAYWAQESGEPSWNLPVPTVVKGVWDETYDGGGNWPFNVAFAASLGLSGAVRQFSSMTDLEPWIVAGVPMAISAAWGPGEIDAAPIGSTDGHLIVVRGFDDVGDVLVDDPASPDDASVPRTYAREQIEGAWLGGSGGITYLVFPPGRDVPW